MWAKQLAWDKFNQLAVFWYFCQGGKREFVNSSHMSVVFQAMCVHPQSHSGWVDLVETLWKHGVHWSRIRECPSTGHNNQTYTNMGARIPTWLRHIRQLEQMYPTS